MTLWEFVMCEGKKNYTIFWVKFYIFGIDFWAILRCKHVYLERPWSQICAKTPRTNGRWWCWNQVLCSLCYPKTHSYHQRIQPRRMRQQLASVKFLWIIMKSFEDAVFTGGTKKLQMSRLFRPRKGERQVIGASLINARKQITPKIMIPFD